MVNYNIFNLFTLKNDEEFQTLIDSLNKEQSIYFLVNSVKHAHRQGIYTLEESEIISKCIRKIYSPEIIQNDVNEKRDE
jgi:hypothetical protein